MTVHMMPTNEPTPILWTQTNRGVGEGELDSETAIALSCHLDDVFSGAQDWDSLIGELAQRDFSLEFQEDRLILTNDQTGISLCTCSFLGHSAASLVLRLGKPTVRADTGKLVCSSVKDRTN